MAVPHRLDMALELARLSQALADALEASDLDAAERFVTERGRLLDEAVATAWLVEPGDTAALTEVHAAVVTADRRSHAALERTMVATHDELGALATGARAMRAYLPIESLPSGYVDRHD